MKFFSPSSRFAGFLAAVVSLVCMAGAQDFDLVVTADPDPVRIDETITFQIGLTNVSGSGVFNVLVTNTLPSSVSFVSADYAAASDDVILNPIGTNANVVLFRINTFPNGGVVVMEVIGQPTAGGSITNRVNLVVGATSLLSTNVVGTVYSSESDLAVGLSPPAEPLYVGDLASYEMSVTNLGPESASAVMLTNPLPSEFELIGVTPSSQSHTNDNGALLFNLGTLANGQARTIRLDVQPTNSGSIDLIASVGAVGLLDTNAVNNTVSNAFVVSAFPTNELVAFTSSAQTFNPQTGLMEQTIILSNASPDAVEAARVNVGGLTNNLFNAVGTNSGVPYVVHASPLAAGAGVELLLEYFNPSLTPGAEPVLTAFAIAPPDLTPPDQQPLMVEIREVDLEVGRVLLEWAAAVGRSYTVIYWDSSGGMTNIAQPSVVAPASRVQWIDDGPPKTISNPANSVSRFYQVLENP
jgi:uncharacterized repeat protein (TIGR01451 family)